MIDGDIPGPRSTPDAMIEQGNRFFAKRDNFPFLTDGEYTEMTGLSKNSERARYIRMRAASMIQEGRSLGKDVLQAISATEEALRFVESGKREIVEENYWLFASQFGPLIDFLKNAAVQNPELLSKTLSELDGGEADVDKLEMEQRKLIEQRDALAKRLADAELAAEYEQTLTRRQEEEERDAATPAWQKVRNGYVAEEEQPLRRGLNALGMKVINKIDRKLDEWFPTALTPENVPGRAEAASGAGPRETIDIMLKGRLFRVEVPPGGIDAAFIESLQSAAGKEKQKTWRLKLTAALAERGKKAHVALAEYGPANISRRALVAVQTTLSSPTTRRRAKKLSESMNTLAIGGLGAYALLTILDKTGILKDLGPWLSQPIASPSEFDPISTTAPIPDIPTPRVPASEQLPVRTPEPLPAPSEQAPAPVPDTAPSTPRPEVSAGEQAAVPALSGPAAASHEKLGVVTEGLSGVSRGGFHKVIELSQLQQTGIRTLPWAAQQQLASAWSEVFKDPSLWQKLLPETKMQPGTFPSMGFSLNLSALQDRETIDAVQRYVTANAHDKTRLLATRLAQEGNDLRSLLGGKL